MLGTPKEELDKVLTIEKHTAELRKRFKFDADRANGKKFSIPAIEGKFDCVTSNLPQRDSWKIRNLLGGAMRKINISIVDDKEKTREDITTTEDLVNGTLYKLTQQALELPGLSETDVLLQTFEPQPRMANFSTILGANIMRFMWTEEDDEPVPDLAIFDPRYTYWISGGKRIIWICNKKLLLKEQAEELYKKTGLKTDVNGYVTAYNCFSVKEGKQAQEGTFIDDEWVIEPENIGLDYIPVRVRIGESYLANNRNIVDDISRMSSYEMTAAGREAKPVRGIEYDGGKDPNPPIKTDDPDPGVKSGFIPLDISKGHKIVEIPESKTNHINLVGQLLLQDYNLGSLSPVAFGQSSGNTAYETDITNRNTREHMFSFKRGMESDLVWLSHEIVSQYKKNDFPKVEVEGFNSKNKRFKTTIDPEKVLDNREFICELVIDELQDRATHSQMAIAEKGAGLGSTRELLDRHGLSQDPDRTIELIAQERANEVANVGIINALIELAEDWDKKPDFATKIKMLNLMTNLKASILQAKVVEKQSTEALAMSAVDPRVKQSKKNMNTNPNEAQNVS